MIRVNENNNHWVDKIGKIVLSREIESLAAGYEQDLWNRFQAFSVE